MDLCLFGAEKWRAPYSSARPTQTTKLTRHFRWRNTNSERDSRLTPYITNGDETRIQAVLFKFSLYRPSADRWARPSPN